MESVSVDGVEVPVLGFGTWRLTDTECRGAVKRALELGYRHVDTAQMYGNERVVGEAIEESPVDREEVFLVTKIRRKNLAPDDLLAFCREEGILLTAFSPLADGAVPGTELLERIGAEYGKSTAQVAIRWLIQQENVAAIPKAASPEHQAENADVFDFRLTDEEMERIAELSRQ